MNSIGNIAGGAIAGVAGAAGAITGTAGAASGNIISQIGIPSLSDILSKLNWGTLLTACLNSFFQSITNSFITSIKALLSAFVLNPDSIMKFSFVEPLFESMRVAGFAVLILIVAWQSFKAIFAWAGFECDEPWRIAVKAIIFALFLYYSKDLLFMMTKISFNIINLMMWTKSGKSAGQQFVDMLDANAISNVNLFTINAVVMIYLVFRLLKAAYKMVERLLLSVVLTIMSPLAFAAGASSATKGFFVGFVRVFTGNLVIQIAQTVCLSAIVMYQSDTLSSGNIFAGLIEMFIVIGLFKITDKLEEIVRDMSISVGFGRDMGSGLLQKAQTVAYTGQSIVNVIKTVGSHA